MFETHCLYLVPVIILINVYFAAQFIFYHLLSKIVWVKDHFVYAIWAPNKFSVSNFDKALLFLDLRRGVHIWISVLLFIFMDAFYGV